MLSFQWHPPVDFWKTRYYTSFYQILCEFASVMDYLTDEFLPSLPFHFGWLLPAKVGEKRIVTCRRTSRWGERVHTYLNVSVTDILKLIKLGPIIAELSVSMLFSRNPLCLFDYHKPNG